MTMQWVTSKDLYTEMFQPIMSVFNFCGLGSERLTDLLSTDESSFV